MKDLGFGLQTNKLTKRIISKSGSYNVIRINDSIYNASIYQSAISLSWLKFILLIFVSIISINLFFAICYLIIGIQNLQGADASSPLTSLLSCFYFSIHTFVTVGYGNIVPKGMLANLFASFEAISGLMCFAITSGLLYGKFSKPSLKIVFSDNALLVNTAIGKSLQFRLANARPNLLMDLQIQVFLITTKLDNNLYKRDFKQLDLQISNLAALNTSWTINHIIDENSPLNGLSLKDIEELHTEIIIQLKAFDETFGQTVFTLHSYIYSEIIENVKFLPAFYTDNNGVQILDMSKINHFERV